MGKNHVNRGIPLVPVGTVNVDNPAGHPVLPVVRSPNPGGAENVTSVLAMGVIPDPLASTSKGWAAILPTSPTWLFPLSMVRVVAFTMLSIFKVIVLLPVPLALMALTTTLVLPTVLHVPEITPEPEFRLKPAGRVPDAKVLGGFVAVII